MALSDIFIPSRNQTAQEQADNLAKQKAQYEAALAARQDAGTVTPEQVAQDQAYVDSVTLDNQDTAAVTGFEEGLNEGFQNVLAAPGKAIGAVGSATGTVLGGIVKNFPWWLWLLLLGAAFFYLAPILGIGANLFKRR